MQVDISADDPPVSFTVCATSRFYYRDERVVFDQPVFNDEQLFNTSTNEFVCPASGTYLLHAFFRSSSGLSFAANVVRNDTLAMSTYSYFNDHNGSNMAIVECNEDEAIWVQTTDNGFMAGDIDGQHSCLSALLLQPTIY